jgi:hypothetical protein
MLSQSPDTSPEAEKVQIELLRKSSISRRISKVRSLSQTVIYLSRRSIQRAKPFLSERQVSIAFVANHYGEKLAERLRMFIGHKHL